MTATLRDPNEVPFFRGTTAAVAEANSYTDAQVATLGAIYEPLGAAAAAVAAHEALPDPHPQYLTPAEGAAAYDALGAAASAVVAHEALADPHPGYLTPAEGAAAYDALGAAAAAVSAHEALADPHPGYLTPAEGAAAYQPLDAELTALSGLTSAADRVPYFTGLGAAALAVLTSFGRTLISAVDAAAARLSLGLGTMAVQNANAVAITGGTAGLTSTGAGGAVTPFAIDYESNGTSVFNIVNFRGFKNGASTAQSYLGFYTAAGTIASPTNAGVGTGTGGILWRQYESGDYRETMRMTSVSTSAYVSGANMPGYVQLSGDQGVTFSARFLSTNRVLFDNATDDGVNSIQVDGSIRATNTANAATNLGRFINDSLGTAAVTSFNVENAGAACSVGINGTNSTNASFGPANAGFMRSSAASAGLNLILGGTGNLSLMIGATAAITVQGTNRRILMGPTLPTDNGATAVQIGAGGISVGNTAVANANTLDWYQEGTFTPVVFGATSAGAGTYSLQVGNYTRIGNMVTCIIHCVFTGHTGTGDLRVSGLPFTSSAINGQYGSCLVFGGPTWTGTGFCAYIGPSTALVRPFTAVSGGGTAAVQMAAAGDVGITITYQV